jgi:transcriptional regulator with XRE-family HTH domain
MFRPVQRERVTYQEAGTVSRPSPPPEAVILRLARKAAGITSPSAASAVGISKARLSQIETGSERRLGVYRPVSGKDSTIARLAAFLGVSPDRLDNAGRGDAAAVLRELQQHPQPRQPVPAGGSPLGNVTPAEARAAEAYIELFRRANRDNAAEHANGTA